MRTIKRMRISDLRPHPKNEKIYGYNEDVSDLIEKIKRSGQVHTLVVNSEGVILAGHRRLKACKELGIKEVDVEVRDFETPEQEIEYIIDNNATREKTNEQKAREAIELKEAISALAKKRRNSKLKLGTSDVPKLAQRQNIPDVPNLAQPENQEQGKTRDILAKKVGFKSGQEVDRAIKTLETIDALDSEGRSDDAKLVRDVLNNRSVSAAESLARNIDNLKEISKKDRKDIQSGTKSPNSFIKKASEKDGNKVVPSAEIVNKGNTKNGSEKELADIQSRYCAYLATFQRDIDWLLSKSFYSSDDDEITGRVCQDLQNCLERFKSINDTLSKMKMDDYDTDSIVIDK